MDFRNGTDNYFSSDLLCIIASDFCFLFILFIIMFKTILSKKKERVSFSAVSAPPQIVNSLGEFIGLCKVDQPNAIDSMEAPNGFPRSPMTVLFSEEGQALKEVFLSRMKELKESGHKDDVPVEQILEEVIPRHVQSFSSYRDWIGNRFETVSERLRLMENQSLMKKQAETLTVDNPVEVAVEPKS